MGKIKELKWNELKYFYNYKVPVEVASDQQELEESVAGGEPCFKPIGQERAMEALAFGLGIKEAGYNLYLCGSAGTGKTTFAKSFAKKIAKTEQTPPDLCYVYNFDNPKCPKLLNLPAGKGKKLQDSLNDVMDRLINDFPKTYSNKDFEVKKNELVKVFYDKRDEIIKEMTEEARLQNFGIKNSNNGIYFMPIIDGEIISEEQFDALSQEKKDDIAKNSESVHKRAAEILRVIKEHEKKTKNDVEELEFSIGLFTVGYHLNEVMEEFIDEDNVVQYLKDLKEDILDNLGEFMSSDPDDEDGVQGMLPWMQKKPPDDIFTRYRVNLLTDNSETEGSPVVVDFNPTYNNLVGEIEYDNEYGNFSTDFMKIKPGLLHKANGGYLILHAQDVLTNAHTWETIRRTLLTGQIVTEPVREHATGLAVSGIKPEPIPINVKIIIVGSGWYYDLLYAYDDHFEKLFKIRVDFDYEMHLNKQNLQKISHYVKDWSRAHNAPPFDISAIGALVEYSTRLSERQERLSTRFGQLEDIMIEACAWAKANKRKVKSITGPLISEAILKRDYRLGMYEEKLSELIESDVIMIDTVGEKVGQINGLAVIDTGDYMFAKPSRITATTYMGKAGIINIEKEADMSGRIHEKGIQVLIGYLGQTYAQDFPLTLSCRICFEQNYSGIDGDSASSTELYAVLSSLARLPIRQDVAVTGSINQHGEIQPIGGVTYKIEGFFDLCKKRGLTGKQGVIIPKRNVRDLILKNEVIEAVKQGKFHIYPIEYVDEGIAILTGINAGTLDKGGHYPYDSVHGKVYRRLKSYNKRATRGE